MDRISRLIGRPHNAEAWCALPRRDVLRSFSFLAWVLLWECHVLFSSGCSDSDFLTVSPTTLPSPEREDLLDNLGGSDPRRQRRWAAEKPLKVGSLPPKKRFDPRSSRNGPSPVCC